MKPVPPDLQSEPAARHVTLASLAEVVGAFLRLGCLSFGGPVAHLGYLRAEFVAKRQWIDDARYGDLVALCQFLPGPASSQVVFALGLQRAGILGAFLASIGFTLPAACLMIAFGYGAATLGDLSAAGWLHGLKLAAVAVVAQAVWGMGQKLCTGKVRLSVCVMAAAGVSLGSGAWSQLAAIMFGAVIMVVLNREPATAKPVSVLPTQKAPHRFAFLALMTFGCLLAGLPVLAATTDVRAIDLFDSFYRSGSLVFGGGHVVLPLLRSEVVPRGWLTDDQFLAGYGAVQAFPGPMFTFSAYLGTAIGTGDGSPHWGTGVWCLVAIFLPAWLLIGGALPFWERLRAQAWSKAALAGANAAVVGVLLAALYDPVFLETVHGKADFVVVVVAFALLEQWKVAPLFVVVGAAFVGQLIA